MDCLDCSRSRVAENYNRRRQNLRWHCRSLVHFFRWSVQLNCIHKGFILLIVVIFCPCSTTSALPSKKWRIFYAILWINLCFNVTILVVWMDIFLNILDNYWICEWNRQRLGWWPSRKYLLFPFDHTTTVSRKWSLVGSTMLFESNWCLIELWNFKWLAILKIVSIFSR